MKMPSKSIYASLTLVFAFALAIPAHARDGQAWGGQCVVTDDSGSRVNSASCDSSGVSCSGDGTGGVSCSWSIAAPSPEISNGEVSKPAVMTKDDVTKR